jgi:hypothetical protein
MSFPDGKNGEKVTSDTHIDMPGKITANFHKSDDVLRTVGEERNVLHAIERKSVWISHFLCRNCFLKHVLEGKKERTRVRGRRLRQLLDELKEKKRYWNLKEAALDRTLSGKISSDEAMSLS